MRQVVIEVEDGIDISVMSVTIVAQHKDYPDQSWVDVKSIDPFEHRLMVVNDAELTVKLIVCDMDGMVLANGSHKSTREPNYGEEVSE